MARRRELVAETKRKSRKIVNPTAFSTQVDNCLAHCIERNLTKNTIDSYVYCLGYLKRFLSDNGHSLDVDEIGVLELKGFLHYLRQVRANKQTTINSIIASLRPFFNYLINQGIIYENPMANITKGKIDRQPIIPLAQAEMANLLKQPDKSTYVGYRNYCLMLVLYSTGMRISECLNLRVKDIDFQNGRILIATTKNRQPKIVWLVNKLKPELQKFARLFLSESLPSDYFFQGQDGGQLKKRSIQQSISDYGKEAKVGQEKRVSPHAFRHTYAINFLRNGGSTASVREQLGHLTITTVEKYLYWSTDEKLEQFQKYNPLDNMNLKFEPTKGY